MFKKIKEIWATHQRKKELEYHKKLLNFIVLNALGMMWCSYVLAWYGREEIAESLSKKEAELKEQELILKNTTNNQEISDALKQRLDLLKNAGIKYVPFKTDADMIESLDLDMLKQAIDKTVEQSDSRSWKYLLSVYDTESVKKFRAEKNQNNGSYNNNNNHKPNGGYSRYSKQYGGRSKIGDKYVDEYTPEEFDKMFKEMQRRKWGTKSAV